MSTPTPAPRAVIHPAVKKKTLAEKAFYAMAFLLMLTLLLSSVLGLVKQFKDRPVEVYYCDSHNSCTEGSADRDV